MLDSEPQLLPQRVLGSARPKLAGPAPPPLGADPPLPNCQVTHCRLPSPPEAFCESLMSKLCLSSGPGEASGPQAFGQTPLG